MPKNGYFIPMPDILRTALLAFGLLSASAQAGKILIPMDLSQTDHLKAYGISRVRFRDMAHRGELPGITKSSW